MGHVTTIAVLFGLLVGGPVIAQDLSDADAKVLKALQEAGSDLSKPHKIDHWLYLPTKQGAKFAAADLTSGGFAVASIQKRKAHWRILATKIMVPSPKNVAEASARLEAVAARYGGEYDGWETQVME